MQLMDSFTPAPMLRPMYNIGCLLDIPTGRYYTGKHGESILNGGLSYITGMGGRGNVFKSLIMFYMMMSILDRYSKSTALVYDTEMSATLERLYQIAASMDFIGGVDLGEEGRLLLTDKVVYSGNAFYEKLKEVLENRANQSKEYIGTTPFVDKENKPVKTYFPFVVAIDSLSQFSTDSVAKVQAKADIGESERNVEALRDAHAKNQLMMELPTVTAKYGCQVMMSAHMGDDLALDPYAPPQKKLAFLKNKVKFKNVPEKFTFLTNNCWFAMGIQVLTNQTTKGPQYPRDGEDIIKGDTDLQVVSIMSIRCKSGPTGLPFDIILSQNEGVKVGLTQYHYINSFNGYGLGGNDRNYYLELLPDVNLSRTTIRSKIDNNEKVRRALEITADMCQIFNYYHDLPKELHITPKELYEKVKAKGYDWDVLLQHTRSYWVFEEEETTNPKKFLSTMDLLKVCADQYKIYWYNDFISKGT